MKYFLFPKNFCLIFIICFMSPCIDSIVECIGNIVDTFCNPFDRDRILERKTYLHEIECVLEYILETRIVQTELFAERIWFLKKWLTFRRIVPNDEMKIFKIHKKELANYYFEKLKNENEANKKTEKCFSMNKKAQNGEGNFLLMKELFNLTNNQLILSKELEAKLDSLQKCSLNFIVNSKLNKFGIIRKIFWKSGPLILPGKTDEEIAILNEYKLEGNKIFSWKWKKEEKPNEAIYEEGDYGFQDLKKCEQMKLVTNKNGKSKMLANEKEKIDAMELLKYFHEEQLFLRDFTKTHLHEIDCILDYILGTRIVQTELTFQYFPIINWQIFRQILPNDEIKNLKIHKNQMEKYYYEKLENKNEANKKTKECFSMNEKAIDMQGNYLSIQKLLSLTENQLILPEEWNEKLDSLEKCLLDFLVNSKFFTFKRKHIRPILWDDLGDSEREILIKEYKNKNHPNVRLQWEWGEKLPKPEETIYAEGDDGFEALKKCEQFVELVIKENGEQLCHYRHQTGCFVCKCRERKDKMLANVKENIDLMKLLKYFSEEQLLFKEFPSVVYYDGNKNIPEKHCPICLENFLINEKLERLYCGHYFHWDCMQENKEKVKSECPICRAKL